MHYYNHLSIWDPETGIVHRYCSVRIIVLSSTYAFLRQLELFIRKLPRWKKQLSYLRGNFISYNPSLIVSYINRLLLMCLLTLSSVSLQLYSHDCQFQSTHRVTSQLAPSLPLPLPPSTPSHIMLPPPNMSISCLRCTDFCLQCSVYSSLPLRKKYLCHQCESAGLDCCLFPQPSAFSILEATPDVSHALSIVKNAFFSELLTVSAPTAVSATSHVVSHWMVTQACSSTDDEGTRKYMQVTINSVWKLWA